MVSMKIPFKERYKGITKERKRKVWKTVFYVCLSGDECNFERYNLLWMAPGTGFVCRRI